MSYDQGGYFIINGNGGYDFPRTKINNILYINKD